MTLVVLACYLYYTTTTVQSSDNKHVKTHLFLANEGSRVLSRLNAKKKPAVLTDGKTISCENVTVWSIATDKPHAGEKHS